jgi:hypothetical protein
MNDKLTRWIQIGSNIAVFGGLVLLIFEMNQNRQLSQAGMISSGYAIAIDTQTAYLGENPMQVVAKSILDPSSLSEAELLIMGNYLSSQILIESRKRALLENGVYGEEVSALRIMSKPWADNYFGNQFAQSWYISEKARGRMEYYPYADEIEAAVLSANTLEASQSLNFQIDSR